MTNKEAINKLTAVLNDDIYNWSAELLTAFGMAVDALRGAEGDCISRKEAIDRIESHLRTGDELYPLTYTDKVVNHGIEIAASCVYNLPSVQPTQTNTSNALQALDCIDRQAAIDFFLAEGMITSAIYVERMPSAQAERRWIPFKTRPLTEEEKEDHPEWDCILDCKLPDDGQWILVSINLRGHEAVQQDEYYSDDGSYLDSGYEIGTEATAWMPLPEPWKEGEADG